MALPNFGAIGPKSVIAGAGGVFNSARDNALSVAILLEVARELSKGRPLSARLFSASPRVKKKVGLGPNM
ncbi:MAG: hypothetical protein AAF251_11955 [Pseudomonadota bacterium]